MSAIKSVVKSVKAVKSVATKKVLVQAIEKTLFDFEAFKIDTIEALKINIDKSETKSKISFSNRLLKFTQYVANNKINAKNAEFLLNMINTTNRTFQERFNENTKATFGAFEMVSCLVDGVLIGENNTRVAYAIKDMIERNVESITYGQFLKLAWGQKIYAGSKRMTQQLIFMNILVNKNESSFERLSIENSVLKLGVNAKLLANLIK
jgi:hypothetical protein